MKEEERIKTRKGGKINENGERRQDEKDKIKIENLKRNNAGKKD